MVASCLEQRKTLGGVGLAELDVGNWDSKHCYGGGKKTNAKTAQNLPRHYVRSAAS